MKEDKLNVLVLGKDPTLFSAINQTQIGDARLRHIRYAERLRERHPSSEIRIITYTSSGSDIYDQPCNGLRIYGTDSIHRATYIPDLLRKIPEVLSDGWRPQVITVQTPWEEGVVGLLLARWLGVRFISQLHFNLFSDNWVAEHWLNHWRRSVAKFILCRSDQIRVVSSLLRDKLIEECGVPINRLVVSPVGVNFVPATGDKHIFKSLLAKDIVDQKVVLFVGRICAQKNLTLWVEVATQVAARVENVRFVIVGTGADEPILRGRIAHAGLTDRFVFTGTQRHDSLPVIYAAADVFLLTSHYEGFGRVVLEAMMSAVPVVSTTCIGPEDIIEHGSDGFLLPCGDANGLAEKVVYLLENEDQAKAFSVNGQRRVMQQFSLQALTDRIIDSWGAT